MPPAYVKLVFRRLNRLAFSRFRVDVLSSGVQVVGDELTEPFASFVYLRRDREVAGYNETGSASGEALPEVVALFKSLLPAQPVGSSSSSDLAEGEGFEPSKGCPLPPFQDGALGHYATPPCPNYYTYIAKIPEKSAT